MDKLPMPQNEMGRLLSLSEFDLDYDNLDENFKDLTLLAAKVAGTEISLINLIDSFTQWSVSTHGIDLQQMPREDSVCQYTIVEEEEFEVKDLSKDSRFSNKFYVTGGPEVRYYFGIPLKTDNGMHIGALCVLDRNGKALDPEKVELLKLIGSEIVKRIKIYKIINELKDQLQEASNTHKKVAHDIRGPIGGIISLTQILSEQGDSNKISEVLEFINLIHKSGNSLLELADEILGGNQAPKLNSDELNLIILKEKLEKLYIPQAMGKDISFIVKTNAKTESIPFSKNKLLQIIGNLISNAIKFTPVKGLITVDLDLVLQKPTNDLKITVKDSGIGISEEGINAILNGTATSTNGTGGENGYGFGLALVRHLIEGLKGTLKIYSNGTEGTTFEVHLPQK